MFRASKEERGTDNRLPQLYNSESTLVDSPRPRERQTTEAKPGRNVIMLNHNERVLIVT
jgi:hypothetical protein